MIYLKKSYIYFHSELYCNIVKYIQSFMKKVKKSLLVQSYKVFNEEIDQVKSVSTNPSEKYN